MPERFRSRLGGGERHAEDGVGAEARLVRRAVKLDHHFVDMALVLRVHAANRVEYLAIDRVNRLLDPLPQIALAAVAQLHRLMRACGRARRHGSAAERAVLQHDVHLHRRIAAAVEYFAGGDVNDGGHGLLPSKSI